MELIEDRHGRRSTIITSQLPVKEWYEVIGEKMIRSMQSSTDWCMMQIELILMETLCEKIKNLEIYSEKPSLKIYLSLNSLA